MVLLTGGRRAIGPLAAAIAGNIYKRLRQENYFSASSILGRRRCCQHLEERTLEKRCCAGESMYGPSGGGSSRSRVGCGKRVCSRAPWCPSIIRSWRTSCPSAAAISPARTALNSTPCRLPLSLAKCSIAWTAWRLWGPRSSLSAAANRCCTRTWMKLSATSVTAAQIATLITNGYLLTVDRIQRLNRAGLDYLQISIDNVTPDETSKKSLKVLDRKLEWLAQHAEFAVTVNSVLGSPVRHPQDARAVALRAKALGL